MPQVVQKSRVRKPSRNAPSTRTSLHAKLAKVKLFLCDVDGVLTNGTVLIGDGKEYKSFSIQDGLGMLLLQRHGIKVGWVSNRASSATRQRSEELKMDFLFQAKGSKVSAIESILAEAKVSWEEVCFMGDDVVDLGALQRAGVAVAVANAIAEVKAVADYVTKAEGGQGAVREVVTLLLQSQNKWEQIIREHSA